MEVGDQCGDAGLREGQAVGQVRVARHPGRFALAEVEFGVVLVEGHDGQGSREMLRFQEEARDRVPVGGAQHHPRS